MKFYKDRNDNSLFHVNILKKKKMTTSDYTQRVREDSYLRKTLTF